MQERQALAHWKRYLAIEADAPDAETVRKKIAAAEAKLDRHFAQRYGAVAEASLEAGRPRRALVMAERALLHRGDDRRAKQSAERAREALAEERGGLARSLSAPEKLPPANALERRLALASLVDLDVAAGARNRTAAEGEALMRAARAASRSNVRALRELASFSTATVQGERGHTGASFARLDAIARLDPERSKVARHAAALVTDPFQNPYGHWLRERARANEQTIAYRLFGPWPVDPATARSRRGSRI